MVPEQERNKNSTELIKNGDTGVSLSGVDDPVLMGCHSV